MKVILLPQAEENLDAIHDPLLSKVLQRLETLEKFPDIGAAMLGPLTGYRSTVIELFRIVYRLEPDNVILVAYIRNCRKRPPA